MGRSTHSRPRTWPPPARPLHALAARPSHHVPPCRPPARCPPWPPRAALPPAPPCRLDRLPMPLASVGRRSGLAVAASMMMDCLDDDEPRERLGDGRGVGVGWGRRRRLVSMSGSGARAAGARSDSQGSWGGPDRGAGRWRNGSFVGTLSIASMPISP
jgi:hypothetical protein